MTHEYVIALNGRVELTAGGGLGLATAIGWAADAILAVGPDETVRSISRGDSTFIDLEGSTVTPLPADLQSARELARSVGARTLAIGQLLVEAGLLGDASRVEPGAAADLAFWAPDAGAHDTPAGWQLRAVVRAGAFTEGDEHRGPFAEPATP